MSARGIRVVLTNAVDNYSGASYLQGRAIVSVKPGQCRAPAGTCGLVLEVPAARKATRVFLHRRVDPTHTAVEELGTREVEG